MFLASSLISSLLNSDIESEIDGFVKKVKETKEAVKKGYKEFLSDLTAPRKKSNNKEDVEFQKEYHGVIARLFSKLIQSANDMNLNKDRDVVSFVNMFSRDFTWIFEEDYRITENTDWVKMGYFCSLLSKTGYEEPKNIIRYVRSWIPKGLPSSEIECFKPIQSSHLKHDSFLYILKFRNINVFYIVFRGTKFFSTRDWNTDFTFETVNPQQKLPELFSGIPQLRNAKVHSGFFEALFEKGSDKKSIFDHVQESLIEMHYQEKMSVVVTGHSMGGGLSAIFSSLCHLLNRNNKCIFKVSRAFTFGAPKVGNLSYCKIFHHKTYRVVNCLDIVTMVPEWLDHQGQEILLTKFLSVEMMEKLRETLPLVSFSLVDHYLWNYVDNYAKANGFICGEKEWKKFEEEKRGSSERNRILYLERVLEEERMKVVRLEREIKKLKSSDNEKNNSDPFQEESEGENII